MQRGTDISDQIKPRCGSRIPFSLPLKMALIFVPHYMAKLNNGSATPCASYYLITDWRKLKFLKIAKFSLCF